MRWNDRTRIWLPWLLLALAVIATVLVYWPGLAGGWVFDDYPNIVDNAAIHILPGHSTIAAWVNAALSSPASFLHRPLASITFALNWYFGGGDPWPFKLTNVIIHVINGVLLYCMLRALLRVLALRRQPAGLPIPVGAAEAATPADAAIRVGPPGPPTSVDGVAGHGTPPRAVGAAEAATPADAAIGVGPPGPPTSVDGVAGHGTPPRAVGAAEAATDATDPPAPVGAAEAATENSDRQPSMAQVAGPAIDEAAAKRLALIVSAAWMLLPINLMAVLYVVQRMESLCQLFVLAGLWAYLHGRWMMLTARDEVRETRGLSLAATGIVLGTLLGLTSKETAVLLPLFAFLAESVVLRFWRTNAGTSARATREPFSVGAAEAATTVEAASTGVSAIDGAPSIHNEQSRAHRSGLPALLQNHRKNSYATDRRLWALFTVTLFIPAILGFLWLLRSALRPGALAGRDFTLAQRLLTEPRVLVDYLHWTLLPNPETLSLYHDEIVKSVGILTPWTTLGAMLLLAALIVVAVLLRNRRPLVALGIGWFFAAQLLTATIVPLELVYEQRMYFASIGVLLAVGALLLGLQWRIRWPLLRGFIVAVALVWFGAATNLRAREWSNPLRLAVAEANRHPESARAVYEAGRQLLIASNYQPGPILDASWKYLRQAAAIPSSSALADQAMIMIVDHQHHGVDRAYWDSMIRKLRDQPTRQEDISALISLTNCYESDICKFDVSNLQHAYEAALSRPHPIARLEGAYADFQRDILHNDVLAAAYLARAVKRAPSEPAYREDLAILYARLGQTENALEQIDALRRMNLAGRLDAEIAMLVRLAEQGKNTTAR